MKNYLILCCLLFSLTGFSQKQYTGRVGPRFLPGHYSIFITIDSTQLTYEVYQHWYVKSYATYRDLTIPLDSLSNFDVHNDSLQITIKSNKVRVKDKTLRINRRIKHRKVCTNAAVMRNISYAVKIAQPHENIHHLRLFESADLNMSYDEFKAHVDQKLEILLKHDENLRHFIIQFDQFIF